MSVKRCEYLHDNKCVAGKGECKKKRLPYQVTPICLKVKK